MSLAFFSLSPMELLILFFGGLLCAGLIASLVVVLVVVNRKPERKADYPSYEDLLEENRQLREEVARLRKEQP
jgi:hypothetical protein